MAPESVMDDDAVDFVMAAWHEDGRWRVEVLPPRSGASVPRLVESLGAHASEGGVLGFVSVAEDFFVLVRLMGQHARFLLSDVGAAVDWPLAADVIERLGLPTPDEDELEDVTPAGDLTIFADLGMSGAEIAILSEDVELYPDQVLGSIASRLGFGDLFEAALDEVPA